MNEIIKVINDQYVSHIHNEVQHFVDMLDFNDKYTGKRKKFTYHVYEDIVFEHDSYESKTAYQYWEYLSVTSTDLKNYLDAINPIRVVDIEFLNEIINTFTDAANKIEEHLRSINSDIEDFYYETK